MINIARLEFELTKKLATTTNEQDILALTKAIAKLKSNGADSALTFASLPSAAANKGKLFIVLSDCTTYFSTGTEWKSMSTQTGGTLWMWGNGANGILGNNTAVNSSCPVTPAGGGTNWCYAASGAASTFTIKTDGTLWTWGANTCGQLGDNSLISRSSPVTTAGGGTTWCHVASGYNTLVAAGVKTDGSLWMWGDSRSGVLGDNQTTTSKSSPNTVAGGGTNWCYVGVGGSCGVAITGALKTDGTLWTWGAGGYGKLGNASTVGQSSPTTIVNLAGGLYNNLWKKLSVGWHGMAAIRQTDSLIWTWGDNTVYGHLGEGTVVSRSCPTTLAAGTGGVPWCAVQVGVRNGTGIKADGTLWAWGFNGSGQLGDNSIIDKSSPVMPCGWGTNWCASSMGIYEAQALKTDGTMWLWGNNNNCQIGDGTSVNKSSPVSLNSTKLWCQLLVGGYYTHGGISYP